MGLCYAALSGNVDYVDCIAPLMRDADLYDALHSASFGGNSVGVEVTKLQRHATRMSGWAHGAGCIVYGQGDGCERANRDALLVPGNQSSLMLACMYMHVKTLPILLHMGASVGGDGIDPLMCAISHRPHSVAMVRFLVGAGQQTMHYGH